MSEQISKVKSHYGMIQEGAVKLLVGERQDSETEMAVMACNDYVRMGRGRSLKRLLDYYEKYDQVAQENNQPIYDIPTKSQRTLNHWCHTFNWVARANAYDAIQEERRNAEAARIMEEGYAQTHQRVAMLDELTRKLKDFLDEKGLTRRIPKGVGFGEDFQIIEEEEFRRHEIKELRGLLDDLASETGGRQKNMNVNASGLAGLLTNSKAFSENEEIEDAEWEPIDDED